VGVAKDVNEKFALASDEGAGTNDDHLLARSRRTATWRYNLGGENKGSWEMGTSYSTVSCGQSEPRTPLTTVLPKSAEAKPTTLCDSG
jgi:hypothetical protein